MLIKRRLTMMEILIAEKQTEEYQKYVALNAGSNIPMKILIKLFFNYMDNLLTPREAAKDLIRAYVERGDSLESLQYGFMGTYSDYHAQIGGYAGELPNLIKVKPDKIAVDYVNGQGIEPQIFSLKELFYEIKSGVRQPALF
ncbi:MAG: hypothetical protein ACYDA4_15260 [Ignavibacteriaceae bacterium]